jgi:hypothetical protein
VSWGRTKGTRKEKMAMSNIFKKTVFSKKE